MIFVKFDKYGALEFIDLQNETIYKGSNRVNRLFVTFDGIDYKTSHYLTFSALVNEKDYGGNLTDLASAKSSYTYNGVVYHGYTFWLFSNLTSQAGTLKLSVRLVDRDTDRVLVSGILPLIVQDTAISTYATVNITTTQYQALLTAFDELSQKIDASNFKTINEESVMGSGDIQLPTYNYVDSRFNNLENENAELNKIISRQDKRIKQLELASEGNILYTTTEDDFGYTTMVSLDTLPFVEIDKIGGMTYKSENLLVLDDVTSTTNNGITYSIKDGVITLNGTASVTTPIVFDTSSYNVSSGLLVWFTSGAINTGNVIIQYYNADTQSWGQVTANSSGKQSLTNINITSLRIYIYASYSYTNVVIKPMLVNGTTAPSEFKQGFNGLRNSAVTGVTSVGANLLNFDDVNSMTTNGITYSIKDGVFTLNGTATTNTFISFDVNIPSGTYTINAFNNQTNANILIQLYTSAFLAGPALNVVNKYEVVKATENILVWRIRIASGTTLNNFTIKPMLAIGENPPSLFKPYRKPITTPISTAIQSLDGYSVGINDTYSNYVDFENRKFLKNSMQVKSTTKEKFRVYDDNANSGKSIEINLGNINTNLIYAERYQTIYDTNINEFTIGLYQNGLAFVPTQSGNYILLDRSKFPDIANYTKDSTEQKQYILNVMGVDEIVVDYVIAITPTETDISDLINDDFIVEVESGGQITFDNEYKQDVLFTWTYQEKM